MNIIIEVGGEKIVNLLAEGKSVALLSAMPGCRAFLTQVQTSW